MPNTVLYYRKRNCLPLWGMATGLGALVVLLAWPVAIYFRDTAHTPLALIQAFRWALVGFELALIPIWLLTVYTAFYWWYMHLEFKPEGLEWKSILPALFKTPFRCAYTEVQRIQRVMYGLIEIVPARGKALRLGSYALTGGQRVLLAELRKRLPPECFEPNLEAALLTHTRYDRLYQFSGLLYGLGLMGVGYTLLLYPLIRSQVAWQGALPPSLFTLVEWFHLDGEGQPWVIRKTFPGEIYQIVHLADTGVTSWDLPPEAKWPQYTPGVLAYPLLVTPDQAGYPWVVLTTESWLRWTGAGWAEGFLTGLPIYDWEKHQIAIGAVQLWAIAHTREDKTAFLFSLKPTSQQAETFNLPALAARSGIQPVAIKATADNQLWVLTSNNQLYLWQSGNWVKTIPLDRAASVTDFTLDQQGNLWVMVENNTPAPPVARLGQYTLTTDQWQWRTLPESTLRPQAIIIDRRNRLWLQTRQSMEVFKIGSGDNLRRLARYTPENSNYQAGYGNGGAQLGPDGRLWVANETLAWVDTNAASLPQPLPEGLVQTTVGPQARTFWLGWLILSALSFYGLSRWIYRHRQIKL